MILDELTLHNFGIYSGRHSFRLTPPSAEKPIILIGGLNGGGKTTLLDAIQLALYGKRARCSGRGGLSYEEYLRRSISRRISSLEGASVALEFRFWTNAKENIYRVIRSWSNKDNGVVKEHVQVMVNGRLDKVTTDMWPELVEEFIPLGISTLFFFDGEKIEGFADLENSKKLLSSAIHSLLGIDIVDRLSVDLLSLERRKRVSLTESPDRHCIQELETELARLEQSVDEGVAQLGAARNELERGEKRVRDLNNLYRLKGGELYDNRESLDCEKRNINGRLQAVELELREVASGPAPLLLVEELISCVETQAGDEEAAVETARIQHLLSERDDRLLEVARNQKIPSEAVSVLECFLNEDRESRASTVQTECYLHLSEECTKSIGELIESVFPELKNKIRELLQKREELITTMMDVERKIGAIPEKDIVTKIIQERAEALKNLEENKRRYEGVAAELERIRSQQELKGEALKHIIERNVEADFENEDIIRTIRQAGMVRNVLANFRSAVIRQHIDRISELVMDSLKQLLRKESLISDIRIDPNEFYLELRQVSGEVLYPDRLSAGERQLLAVSLLWGLARASDRPLPTIIDTPLGRLDASHRAKLIDRYFPYASHQILLLSTDEEINEAHYKRLEPWIGHTYHLAFNDSLGVTRPEAGYFW